MCFCVRDAVINLNWYFNTGLDEKEMYFMSMQRIDSFNTCVFLDIFDTKNFNLFKSKYLF